MALHPNGAWGIDWQFSTQLAPNDWPEYTTAPRVSGTMAQMLRSAIAYRQDFHERESWENAREDAIPVSCPSECTVEYDLIVSQTALGDEVLKWIEAVLIHMEAEHPHHGNVIVL